MSEDYQSPQKSQVDRSYLSTVLASFALGFSIATWLNIDNRPEPYVSSASNPLSRQARVLAAQLIPDANKDGLPDLRVDFDNGESRIVFGDKDGRFRMSNAFERLSPLKSHLELEVKPEATQVESLEGK